MDSEPICATNENERSIFAKIDPSAESLKLKRSHYLNRTADIFCSKETKNKPRNDDFEILTKIINNSRNLKS